MSMDKLRDKKGSLSRAIGQAKKQGNPTDVLMKEMKGVSLQIKLHEAESKNIQADRLPIDTPVERAIPALFGQRFIDANAAKPEANPSADAFSIKAVDKHSADEWDAYIASKAESSVYHDWCLRQVIEQNLGHKALYLLACDSNDKVCDVLPLIEATLLRIDDGN